MAEPVQSFNTKTDRNTLLDRSNYSKAKPLSSKSILGYMYLPHRSSDSKNHNPLKQLLSQQPVYQSWATHTSLHSCGYLHNLESLEISWLTQLAESKQIHGQVPKRRYTDSRFLPASELTRASHNSKVSKMT